MALDDCGECDERRRVPSAEEDAVQMSKALPPPAMAGGVKAEIIWRGDVAVLAFPGGREFPTNIRREGVQTSAYGTTASAGLPTAKIIRLGSQTMWGDIDWFCFPCDMMTASGSPGTAVFGIACGKHHAVAFKLRRGETDGEVAFLTDDNKDEDEIDDDDIASTSSLSANLRTARGIRCSVASGDRGWIAATMLAGGRECEVHVWKPLAVADRAGWTWLFTGTARFVLPLGFHGSVADAVSIDGECAVLRQSGYPDLRFQMRSPRHLDTEPEDSLRWSPERRSGGCLVSRPLQAPRSASD